tara:strand:+ start:13983 stop:14615 length:633 start_codon:yes stop_codon:yes gene_type:complete
MKKCYCGKNRKDSLLNMLKGDMFGKANLNMKNMKVKTCLAQSCLLLTVLVILYFFFYGHAYEIEFRFPLESHLKEAPNLRSEDGRINDPALRTLVVPLLKEQCGSMEDVDILFCFQLVVDGKPLYSPCFMDCRSKEFYYDLTVMETDKPGVVRCVETYSTLELIKERPERVAIKGLKTMELEEFVNVPSSQMNNCLMQHANEVARGLWLK